MPQKLLSLEKPSRIFEYSETGISVPVAGETVLAEVPIPPGCTRLFLQVRVSGAAFDAFKVEGRVTNDAPYSTLLAASTDYISQNAFNERASGDLTTLAADALGYMRMNVSALSSVRILASCGVSAGTAEIYIRVA